MRLFVGLAIFDCIDAAVLDDTAALEVALRRGVEAGRFTLFDLRVVRFSPHGVTAAAIVGESHLTLHSWPEEGRLFVDVASCSSETSVRDAIAAIGAALPGAQQAQLSVHVLEAPFPSRPARP